MNLAPSGELSMRTVLQMPFPVLTAPYSGKTQAQLRKIVGLIEQKGGLRGKAHSIAEEKIESGSMKKIAVFYSGGKTDLPLDFEKQMKSLKKLGSNLKIGDYPRVKKRLDRMIRDAAVRIVMEEIFSYWLKTNPAREARRIAEFVKYCTPSGIHRGHNEYINMHSGEIWDFLELKGSLETIPLIYRAIESLGRDPQLEFKEVSRVNLLKLEHLLEKRKSQQDPPRPAQRILDDTIDTCYDILKGAGVRDLVRRGDNSAPYRIMLLHFSKYFTHHYPIRGMRFPIQTGRGHGYSLRKLKLRHRRLRK